MTTVAEVLWPAVAAPLAAGLGLSLLLDLLVQPGVRPFWRRPAPAMALHLGLWLVLFAAALALFRRPWFAAALVLALQLLLVLVANAKFCSLREPFIFQDFEYFIDALKHPRLYLPFLGLGRALLAAAGFVAALYAGLRLESSLTDAAENGNFLLVPAALVAGGLTLLWLGARKRLPVQFEPETDLRQLGLLSSLWRYGEEERAPCPVADWSGFAAEVTEMPGTLPNLVVVQSESFFDARQLFAGIRPDILREFDGLKGSAACFGKLAVPAWGANTVRSEFAFLSGLTAESLGIHRFNPYRKLARQQLPTLAGFLRRLGYHTVCVHPYPAGFYSRDQVFPLLGFDRFLDIRSFAGAEKAGPYIGDVALAEKVCALLGDAAAQPIFLFVITMENHGPLHLEKVWKGDEERLYSCAPPAACADLTIYLRHLANADRMAGMLRDCLEASPGPAWLCWYGDHVPIMPGVYATLGTPDGHTDYLLWQKGGSSGGKTPQAMDIDQVGMVLLQNMGLVQAG